MYLMVALLLLSCQACIVRLRHHDDQMPLLSYPSVPAHTALQGVSALTAGDPLTPYILILASTGADAQIAILQLFLEDGSNPPVKMSSLGVDKRQGIIAISVLDLIRSVCAHGYCEEPYNCGQACKSSLSWHAGNCSSPASCKMHSCSIGLAATAAGSAPGKGRERWLAVKWSATIMVSPMVSRCTLLGPSASAFVAQSGT
jgi:hypothetical protein